MEKVCTRCKVSKPLEMFSVDKSSKSGYQFWCKVCRSEYKRNSPRTKEYAREYRKQHPGVYGRSNKKYRQEHPEKSMLRDKIYRERAREERPDELAMAHRKHRLKKVFGITIEDYNNMFEAQSGVCAICGKPGNPRKNHGRLFVDHNHKNGTVRGLLCHHCNTALGMANDDVDTLHAMIAYLKRHS